MSSINPGAADAAGDPLAQDFVAFAVESGVLRFGEFKTKAGRLSPYFFNAGGFDDGAKLARLAEFYARRLLDSGVAFDMLFGPAYKGITLCRRGGHRAGATRPQRAVRLQPQGGQGARRRRHAGRRAGRRPGADHRRRDHRRRLQARGADLLRASGAEPVAVAIALDRQERASDDAVDRRSGVQFVEQSLQLQVVSIATLGDLLAYLARQRDPRLAASFGAVTAYRERYGI